MSPRPNPYHTAMGWYFHDETGEPYGPFRTQRKATRHLLRYCRWLDHGPTRMQSLWWPVRHWFKHVLWEDMKRFWYDTRGTR